MTGPFVSFVRVLALLVALVVLHDPSRAQNVIWKPLVAPTMPQAESVPQSQWPQLVDGLEYPVVFEKCPVTDEFGHRIYITRVLYYLNGQIEGDLTVTNTNPAGLPTSDLGWGSYGIGARPFLSKLPLGDDANHSPIWHTGGDQAFAASVTWDSLPAGSSVSQHVRVVAAMLFEHRVGTDEYRKWQGPGSTTFLVTLDRWTHVDMTGHWSVSGVPTLRFAVHGIGPGGVPCHGWVGYEYTTTPPVERFSIVEGPWAEVHGVPADEPEPQPVVMHGFEGDASRISQAWIEVMQSNRLPRWIENTTPNHAGICGGDAELVAEWMFPVGPENTQMTTGVGSGNQNVPGFDSVIDGLGSSGRTSAVNNAGYAQKRTFEIGSAYFPSLIEGDVEVSMRVASSRISPAAVTQGCTFAWSGAWFAGGWVREVTKERR